MTRESLPTVGFVGLGVMGAAMAANIARAGYPLVVHDTRRAAGDALVANGAEWAANPRAVAKRAAVVLSCLPGLAAIEAVALGDDGVLAGIGDGGVYFDTSTGSVELARHIHAAFAARGAHMLEAPISGGAPGAVRGRLAIWVGGDRSAYDRYEAVLQTMGNPIHLGAIGTALTTKLVNNCASQMVQAAIAEVFVLGVKAGAEPLALWQALRQGMAGSRRTFDGLIDQYLPGSFDSPHAALGIIDKDMMLATQLARDLGVPMRIGALAQADIVEAMNRGWGERDCRSVMLLPQERAGVSVQVDPTAIRDVLRADPAAPSDIKHGQEMPE